MEGIMQNVPWNKGHLTGHKRPLKPKDVWAIRVRLQLEHRARDLALFNLAIDSSSEAATSCGYKLTTFAPAPEFETAPPSFRRRQVGRFSSKLPSRPGPRSKTDLPRSARGRGSTSSRAVSGRSPTCRHASMRGPSMAGSRAPGLKAPPTACIRCADEGGADLQEDGQPASRPAAPRAYEARKHSSPSRHRGR